MGGCSLFKQIFYKISTSKNFSFFIR